MSTRGTPDPDPEPRAAELSCLQREPGLEMRGSPKGGSPQTSAWVCLGSPAHQCGGLDRTSRGAAPHSCKLTSASSVQMHSPSPRETGPGLACWTPPTPTWEPKSRPTWASQ